MRKNTQPLFSGKMNHDFQVGDLFISHDNQYVRYIKLIKHLDISGNMIPFYCTENIGPDTSLNLPYNQEVIYNELKSMADGAFWKYYPVVK